MRTEAEVMVKAVEARTRMAVLSQIATLVRDHIVQGSSLETFGEALMDQYLKPALAGELRSVTAQVHDLQTQVSDLP